MKKVVSLVISFIIVLSCTIGVSAAESVPENVIAIPRTESKEELAEIYSVADVFVNLSTCSFNSLI